jgi:hypothetical protein
MIRPRSQGRGRLHECAPGRAASLQNWRGVQIVALVLADVAEELGIGFVNRLMLVRLQPSAPYLDSVMDRTGLS